MVGFCGIAGDRSVGLDPVVETIVRSEDGHGVRYRGSGIDLYASFHRPEEATAQPAATDDGRRLCIWGDVLGHERGNGYEPRSRDGESDAKYCVRLLERHGTSFVDGLNSEFAGIVFDERDGAATLFTDRLGARPIYYTERIDGAVLFSTHPRTVLAHPAVDPTVDKEALVEFLSFERVFGTETPFDELRQLHPGSRLRYDPDRDTTSRTVYWRPEYDPDDRSYDDVVREFAAIYRRAVAERRDESRAEAVLISGGSDSRSLLAALGENVMGYHMNETRNAEAETARRVCEFVGAEFRFLERDPAYLARVLSTVAGEQLFASFFDQAHAAGFEDAFGEADAIFCGQYSDTILSGQYLPERMVDVPGLGWTVPLPVPASFTGPSEYVEYVFRDHEFTRNPDRSSPDYLRGKYDLRSILDGRIGTDGGEVVHHGVGYPGLEELQYAGGYYPLSNTNGYLFYYSLNQMAPTHYPFLDNRIVDLALSMPGAYHARRNVVNRALEWTAPDLAEIPHAETGLPLTYPQIVHHASEYVGALADKVGREGVDGAWPDRAAVLRETNVVSRYLLEDDPCWEEIDPTAVRAVYGAHLRGEDRYFDLYALLSLCTTYPFCEPADVECGE